MQKFIIDTDTGSDDAVALVMACKHPEVQIEAVTIVAGNVPLELGIQNALYTLELCGAADVPVYPGLARPLLRQLETAQYVHGQDGMGDIGLPLSGRKPQPEHAVDVLVEKISDAPGEITLVTLGPLSNVAVALLRDPSLAEKVQHCYVMGGTGSGHGNTSPVAEFNIWVDPEAAKIVFHSGMPITMVGWDMSRIHATFGPEDVEALRAIGTPLSTFCVDIQRFVQKFAVEMMKLEGFDLPDPIAMAVAIDPTIAETVKRHVTIDVSDGIGRGQTINDHLGILGAKPNVHVVTHVSRQRFLDMLRASMSDRMGNR